MLDSRDVYRNLFHRIQCNTSSAISFSLRKIIEKSASKKNEITLRRIRKVGVLTLFKKGTRNKFRSMDMRGFFTRSLLWFPQILVIIAGTGI